MHVLWYYQRQERGECLKSKRMPNHYHQRKTLCQTINYHNLFAIYHPHHQQLLSIIHNLVLVPPPFHNHCDKKIIHQIINYNPLINYNLLINFSHHHLLFKLNSKNQLLVLYPRWHQRKPILLLFNIYNNSINHSHHLLLLHTINNNQILHYHHRHQIPISSSKNINQLVYQHIAQPLVHIILPIVNYNLLIHTSHHHLLFKINKNNQLVYPHPHHQRWTIFLLVQVNINHNLINHSHHLPSLSRIDNNQILHTCYHRRQTPILSWDQ